MDDGTAEEMLLPYHLGRKYDFSKFVDDDGYIIIFEILEVDKSKGGFPTKLKEVARLPEAVFKKLYNYQEITGISRITTIKLDNLDITKLHPRYRIL